MRRTTLALVLRYFALLVGADILHGQSNTAVADAAVSVEFQDSGPATVSQGVSIFFEGSGGATVGQGVTISFDASGGATLGAGVAISFQSGGINVTTNLSAASFTISGPTTYTGRGTAFSQPAAPPGQYTITYGAVKGYTTPTPQTQTLAVAGAIIFTGTYTT